LTSDGAASTKSIGGRGYGSGTSGDSQIHFRGNEDLGNGLKASFFLDIGLDPNAGAHTMANRESWVGLSGGFGSLKIGTNYTPGFMGWLVTGGDPLGANNVVGNMVMVQQLNDVTNMSIFASQSILYESPAILPGLTVQAMRGFGNDEDKVGDRTAFGVRYINGPIAAQFSNESITGADMGFVATDAATFLTSSNSGTDKRKSSIYSASYDLGVAKVATSSSKSKIVTDDDSTKASSYSVSAPFGALSVAYTTSTATVTAAAVQTKYKGTQLGLTYSLSKRTNVYMASGTQKDADDSSLSLKQTSFGIAHNF
jgi:predicted porin